MRTCLQIYRRFRLPLAEMNVVGVGGNGRRYVGKFGVDDEVMMPGVGFVATCWRDVHALDAESDCDGARDGRSGFRLNDKNLCSPRVTASLEFRLGLWREEAGREQRLRLRISSSISMVRVIRLPERGVVGIKRQ